VDKEVTDHDILKEVWVFIGERPEGATTITLPSGVFSTLKLAESWIAHHQLSGLLTFYRVDVGAYDWAIEHGYFRPSKPHHNTASFIGQFAGGDQHHHYVNGRRSS